MKLFNESSWVRGRWVAFMQVHMDLSFDGISHSVSSRFEILGLSDFRGDTQCYFFIFLS